MAKTESGRRKLKPVIEKKRRDRINQNLAVLRTLLFNSTADTRLQNPKLEKAEILDLAVQYIRKNTCEKTDKKESIKQTVAAFKHSQANSLDPASAAHTHQCVSDFTSFMGPVHNLQGDNSRMCLEYYLDCPRSHSSASGRESDTKSPISNTELRSSTTVPHSYTQDPIFTEASSIAFKFAHQVPIILTSSEQLSPPPSPLYMQYTHYTPSVSPPSSAPVFFTTASSVRSPGNSSQVFPTSQSTWRPWS